MSKLLATVDEIATNVIAKNAVDVDRNATFPTASIDALRAAGVLGLMSSKEVGGAGEGPRAAAAVVERIARECGSTAMVLTMHYAGTSVIEKFGQQALRRDVASGKHLSTLAFSEMGSRSHFWAPVGTAEKRSDGIHLHARKSFCTSANHATAYIWSSKPIAGDGASTLWLVPRDTRGVSVRGNFDGLGLRGNDSTPIVAEGAVIPETNRLGDDGAGLSIMLETVLPLFNVFASACAIGLMDGATTATCAHVASTRYEHMDSSLADLPTIRAYVARMRIATDQASCLLADTITAIETGRADTMLRVLESKAAAGESATAVLDLAMRVCGGAAFRREVGVERRFRDARAGTIMAPTTDQLYDFIGRALTGLPVF